MVKNLRKKFVIITTSLMVIIFGLFLMVSQFYNEYWNTLDTVEFLETLADSGLFLQYEPNDVEKEILDVEGEESPIIGIVLSETGDILKNQILGDGRKAYVPEEVIDQIIENGSDRYKAGRYVYAYRQLEDDTSLIVLTDNSMDMNENGKVPLIVLLILAGISVLVALTFFLSRFVTEPAKAALLREKQFISDASHELKTPLGAISINAQVLDSQYPKNLYVKNIASESDRMGRLIERLLTLSKLEEQDEVKREKVSLSEITEEMSMTFESTAFEKKLDYRYQVEDECFIMGNADDLRQLLSILIDNAIKNTDELGIIDICCKNTRGNAYLSVANTGRGIAPEDLPHVFERFYTSDSSRNNNSFGLGLAIAKTIVERYDGNITVESQPEKTTTFTVAFRLA